MNVIVKLFVGITQPHHLLCIQIIILTIQAKNINNKASGHENENYQKNTRIVQGSMLEAHSHCY